MKRERLSLKFDGAGHEVDLKTFAHSVLSFAEVIKEANSKITDQPVDIKVGAPKEGSLIVDILTDVASGATEIVGPAASLVTIVGGLYGLQKFIAGKEIDTVEPNNDQSTNTITLNDGSSMTVNGDIYQIYVDNPTISDSIAQNFAALQNDSAVSSFSILDESEGEVFSVNKDEYKRLTTRYVHEDSETRTSIETAHLNIYKIYMAKRDNLKWEFYREGSKISATIKDTDFLAKLESGEFRFANGDRLEVDLEVVQAYDPIVDTYVNREYSVVRVINHLKRKTNKTFPFQHTTD